MDMTTGERARQRREGLGLARDAVARRLGLSPEGYGHYERGRTPFNEEHLRELSKILRVPVSWLLGELSDDEFEDEQAAIYYNGIAPALRPAAKAALKALYEQSDKKDA